MLEAAKSRHDECDTECDMEIPPIPLLAPSSGESVEGVLGAAAIELVSLGEDDVESEREAVASVISLEVVGVLITLMLMNKGKEFNGGGGRAGSFKRLIGHLTTFAQNHHFATHSQTFAQYFPPLLLQPPLFLSRRPNHKVTAIVSTSAPLPSHTHNQINYL